MEVSSTAHRWQKIIRKLCNVYVQPEFDVTSKPFEAELETCRMMVISTV